MVVLGVASSSQVTLFLCPFLYICTICRVMMMMMVKWQRDGGQKSLSYMAKHGTRFWVVTRKHFTILFIVLFSASLAHSLTRSQLIAEFLFHITHPRLPASTYTRSGMIYGLSWVRWTGIVAKEWSGWRTSTFISGGVETNEPFRFSGHSVDASVPLTMSYH